MSPLQELTGMTAADLGALLDAGRDALVTLEAGETSLAAHRAVLAARSPVFAAMFAHDTREASSGVVAIRDVEGPVLRQVLAYLYTLQPPHLPDMAGQLLAAADKYGLAELKAACEEQVAAQLRVETAAAAAVLAVRHSCDGLMRAAVSFVKANLVDVMSTRGWADAMLSQPGDLIEVSRLLNTPLAETSETTPEESGTSPYTITQLDRDQTAEWTSDASSYTPLTEDVSISLLSEAAPEESGASPGPATQPASEHSDWYQKPDSAAWTSGAFSHSLLSEDVAVSLLSETDLEESWISPDLAMQPASNHNDQYQEAGSAALTMDAASHTPTPQDVNVSRLRSLSTQEKGRRLIEAAREGDVQEMESLLAAGADVGATNMVSMTALHWAAREGHLEAARCLLVVGAAVDAESSTQSTPLHFASWKGHGEVARQLIAAGANHSARNQFGYTPLHFAADSGHVDVAAALLTAGADRGVANSRGNTPLDIAREKKHQQLVDLLTTSSWPKE